MPRNRTEPGVPEGQVRIHEGNEGSTGLLSGVAGTLPRFEVHDGVTTIRPVEASYRGLQFDRTYIDDLENWARGAATGTTTSAVSNEPRPTLTLEDIRRAAAVLDNHQVPEPYFTLIPDRDRELAEIQRVQIGLGASMARAMDETAIRTLLYGARREGEDRDRREFERARRYEPVSAQRQTNYQSLPTWAVDSGIRSVPPRNDVINLNVGIHTYDAMTEWMRIVYELRGYDSMFRALMGSAPPPELAVFLRNMERDEHLYQHGKPESGDLYTLRIMVVDTCMANVILRPKLSFHRVKQPDLFPEQLLDAVRQNPPKPVLDQDPD